MYQHVCICTAPHQWKYTNCKWHCNIFIFQSIVEIISNILYLLYNILDVVEKCIQFELSTSFINNHIHLTTIYTNFRDLMYKLYVFNKDVNLTLPSLLLMGVLNQVQYYILIIPNGPWILVNIKSMYKTIYHVEPWPLHKATPNNMYTRCWNL